MKKFLFAILFVACSTSYANYSFSIQPREYLFSTEFDIYCSEEYLYSVESNFWQLHKSYSVCDHSGEVVNGTARLLSMGSIFNAMKQIDVTDSRGKKLGYIKGYWWTSASRKFAIYDEYNRHYATAYVGRNWNSVSIVNATNERIKIATLVRNYIPGGTYQWDATVYNENALDLGTLYVFSSFIADTCKPYDGGQSGDPTTADVIGGAIQTGLILDAIFGDDE